MNKKIQNVIYLQSRIENDLLKDEPSSHMPWLAFSPQQPYLYQVTDLNTHWKNNKNMWEAFLRGKSNEDIHFDQIKIHLNSLGLTVNWGKYHIIKNHIPILIRITKYTHSLKSFMHSLCSIRGIQQTLLFVMISANMDVRNILKQVIHMKCVSIRVFFHPYDYEMEQQWEDVKVRNQQTFNFEQFLSGCFLTLNAYQYPYVIILEDHLQVSSEIYYYHLKMSKMNPKPMIVNSVSEGPYMSCHTICHGNQNQIMLENYFNENGVGISSEILPYLYHMFPKYDDVPLSHFLIALSRIKNWKNVVPCSNRVAELRDTKVRLATEPISKFYIVHS